MLTAEDLKQIPKRMSMKYCDLDPITTWLLMSWEYEIMPSLVYIINEALESGNFLTVLKIPLVKPNLKNANLDYASFGNSRPISNISFISKVLENCILLQISGQLHKNDLWGGNQSAYRKFHSCETATTKIMDDLLKNKDQEKDTLIIFRSQCSV